MTTKKQKKVVGRWTKAEQNRFLQGLSKFGRNWVQVQKIVKTRTLVQVRSHAQKVFLKMSEQDIYSIMEQDNSYQQSVFDDNTSNSITDSNLESICVQKNQDRIGQKVNIDLVGIFMKAIEDSKEEIEGEEVKTCQQSNLKNISEKECEGLSDAEASNQVSDTCKVEQKTIFNY